MKLTRFSHLFAATALWTILVSSAAFAEPATKANLAARQLQTKISEQESAARAVADEINALRKQESPADETVLMERQRKLRQVLTDVFDLKLQLEELQIKELQERLTRCDQQLRQRRDLRDKIIDHRLGQLIDKSVLDWNSTDPTNPIAVNAAEGQAKVGLSEGSQEDDLPTVLKRYFPRAELECHKLVGGNVLIRGTVENSQTVMQVMDIANLYATSVLNQIVVDPDLATRAEEPVKAVSSASQPHPPAPRERAETELQSVLKKYFPDAALECHELINDSILIRGFVRDSQTARQVIELARVYAAEVINHIVINPDLAKSNAAIQSQDQTAANSDDPSPIEAGSEKVLVNELQSALKRELPEAILECVERVDGKFIITGLVPDHETFARVLEIAHRFVPKGCLHNVRIVPGLLESHRPAAEATSDVATTTDSAIAQGSSSSRRRGLASAADPRIFSQEAVSTKSKRQEVLDKMRKALEPIANEMTAAAKNVRELEEKFFHGNDRLEELKQAVAQFKKSSREFFTQLREFEPLGTALEDEKTLVQIAVSAQDKFWNDRLRIEDERMRATTFSKPDVANLKKLLEAKNAAKQNLDDVNQKLANFRSISRELNPLGLVDSIATPAAKKLIVDDTATEYRADVAQAFLQSELNAKLELVSCEGLGLWFHKALRVRETCPEYERGDLIVQLNGFIFDNWDQAVRGAKTPETKNNTNERIYGVTYVKGGLIGQVFGRKFSPKNLAPILQPSEIDQVIWNFEVLVKGNEAGKSEVRYVAGICVSPTGLVSIPVNRLSISLADGEAIRVNSNDTAQQDERLTASIVDSDTGHGLTLVQLNSERQRPFYRWTKCSAALPVLNQTLYFLNRSEPCKVVEANLPYAPPLVGNDCFRIECPNSHATIIGQPVSAFNGNIQGVLLESHDVGLPVDPNGQDIGQIVPRMAMPAVHIEKLMTNYLEKYSK